MLDIPILTMSKENCTFAGGPRRTKVTSDAPAYFDIFCLIRELVHLSKKITQFDVLPPRLRGGFAQFSVNLPYILDKYPRIS